MLELFSNIKHHFDMHFIMSSFLCNKEGPHKIPAFLLGRQKWTHRCYVNIFLQLNFKIFPFVEVKLRNSTSTPRSRLFKLFLSLWLIDSISLLTFRIRPVVLPAGSTPSVCRLYSESYWKWSFLEYLLLKYVIL